MTNLRESNDRLIAAMSNTLNTIMAMNVTPEELKNMDVDEFRAFKALYELVEATNQYTTKVTETLEKIDEIDRKVNQVLEQLMKS